MPWTRLVTAAKTTYDEKAVDLPEFIVQNRERLALKPNDDYSDQHSYFGWEMDAAGWDRALKQAMRVLPTWCRSAWSRCARCSR